MISVCPVAWSSPNYYQPSTHEEWTTASAFGYSTPVGGLFGAGVLGARRSAGTTSVEGAGGPFGGRYRRSIPAANNGVHLRLCIGHAPGRASRWESPSLCRSRCYTRFSSC